MQLVRLHDDFWRIEDALSERTIKKLQKSFKHRDCWQRLGQGSANRDEGTFNQGLKLAVIENKISEYFGTTCFANATQLWYDYDGYINETHCDLSPNLSANVQIYLCEGEIAMGKGEKKLTDSEINNALIARKSIVASSNISKGERFTEINLAVKRPANGISPMRWKEVIGQLATKDFKKDEPISL